MTYDLNAAADRKCFTLTRFERWEPGVFVRLRVDPPTPLTWFVAMILSGACGALAAGSVVYAGFRIFLQEGGSYLFFWEVFVLTGIPASILGAMYLAGADTFESLEIDWKTRRLRWTTRFRTREFNMEDIQALVLRSEYHERSVGTRREHRYPMEKVYRARLDAELEGATVLLLQTDSQQQHLEIALEELAPVARRLADSLGVELHTGAPLRERHEILRPLAKAPVVLHAVFLVLVIAAGGWAAWRAQPAWGAHQAQRQIKARGGMLATRDEWRIGNTQHGPVRSISFKDRAFSGDDLVALGEALSALGRFQLDLSDTGVSDEGLRALAGNPRLAAINLHGTRVTDHGVEALRECPALIEVNLTRTRVTDAAILHLRHLDNLSSLRLWGTRVTDAGVDDLLEMKNLREIYLYDTAVTPEALARLKSALPNTQVHP